MHNRCVLFVAANMKHITLMHRKHAWGICFPITQSSDAHLLLPTAGSICTRFPRQRESRVSRSISASAGFEFVPTCAAASSISLPFPATAGAPRAPLSAVTFSQVITGTARSVPIPATASRRVAAGMGPRPPLVLALLASWLSFGPFPATAGMVLRHWPGASARSLPLAFLWGLPRHHGSYPPPGAMPP